MPPEISDDRFAQRLERIRKLHNASGLFLGAFAVGAVVAGAGWLLDNAYIIGLGTSFSVIDMGVGYTTEQYVRYEQGQLEAIQPGCTDGLFGPKVD